jgi:hypothetical protein
MWQQFQNCRCNKKEIIFWVITGKTKHGLSSSRFHLIFITRACVKYFNSCIILYVPLILQQIQISVDQPYAGPGCQLLHYQRDI